ncbi:hypothetical protein UCREL1_8270 [Eutypa lata UCREL1]|uniref:Uncharacterized protein n=1 Tax=Eutypa lata (strain UCR-EL1) TaxID=1287681 RepID=M7T4N1_EUTLA|nr:hypothetical protein UCREL1_8270 [Eutypa lata UCREL1]
MSDIEKVAEREAAKQQPWKEFWVSRPTDGFKENTDQTPWLAYTPDPEKPDAKPWYNWLQAESPQVTSLPGYVCRSGSNS